MRKSFFALAALFFAGAAHAAFEVVPPMVTLKTSMNEKMAWVEVVHSGGGEAMAVEVSVLNRVLNLDGEVDMTNRSASKDFTVYPTQIILRPGERSKVQIRYNGKGRVTKDVAYTLFSREIPMPLQAGETEGVRTGVNTLVQYFSVLAFETDKPGKLTFVSSKKIEDGKIEVIAENRSSGRVQMQNMTLTIGKEKITDFTGKKNSVMPGQQRRMTFKYGRPVTAKEIVFGGK